MDEAAKPHFKSSKRHGLFAKVIEMEITERNAIQVFIEILKIHKGRNITWALSPHVIYDSIAPYVSLMPEAKHVDHI